MNGLLFALATFGLAAAGAAQNACPYERVRSVPASWTVGPLQACDSGLDVQVGAVQLRSKSKTCPLFVVITPTHEVAEPSTAPTMVEQVGSVEEQVAYFDCVSHYFLVFSLGDSCQLRDVRVLGLLPRLTTVGCPIADTVDS